MNETHVKKEILDFLNRTNRSFTSRDALSFMSLIRTTMEHLENKENWKVINFYCNWTLHKQLSENNYGHTPWVFNLLSEALNSHWGNDVKILETVATAVGLETLRDDMKSFLRSIFNIGELSDENTFLTTDFWETIAYLILDKPVLNKKNKTGQYTSGKLNITHPQSGYNIHISKIQVTAHLDSEGKEIAALSIFLDPHPPLHENDNTPFGIYQINKLS